MFDNQHLQANKVAIYHTPQSSKISIEHNKYKYLKMKEEQLRKELIEMQNKK